MVRSCWTCNHYRYDRACDGADCLKADKMPEKDYDDHFINDKPNCPFWAEYDVFVEGLAE